MFLFRLGSLTQAADNETDVISAEHLKKQRWDDLDMTLGFCRELQRRYRVRPNHIKLGALRLWLLCRFSRQISRGSVCVCVCGVHMRVCCVLR